MAAVMRRALAAVWACALALAGCASANADLHPPRVTEAHWVSSYVLGVWGTAEFDIRDDCPSGVAESVRIGPTWATLLVSIGTLGLYTPREVIVHCRVIR